MKANAVGLSGASGRMTLRVNVPAFSPFLYRFRNLVERFFSKINHFRYVHPGRLEILRSCRGSACDWPTGRIGTGKVSAAATT